MSRIVNRVPTLRKPGSEDGTSPHHWSMAAGGLAETHRVQVTTPIHRPAMVAHHIRHYMDPGAWLPYHDASGRVSWTLLQSDAEQTQ